MRYSFREQKATQAAALLLRGAGGHMNLMKLVKLLYLADREALVRLGRHITLDQLCSLRHGPIVSNILNLINEQPDPNDPRYWHRFISERKADYEVALDNDPGVDQLSRAEEEIIAGVLEKFGHMSQWELRDYTHGLPEWRDPGDSMLPINIADILLPEGYSEEEIAEIEETLDHSAYIRHELHVS